MAAPGRIGKAERKRIYQYIEQERVDILREKFRDIYDQVVLDIGTKDPAEISEHLRYNYSDVWYLIDSIMKSRMNESLQTWYRTK